MLLIRSIPRAPKTTSLLTRRAPTRFAEPERKHASPSPSHYENKPMPPRPQEGYGRPHAGSAGRLSPAGHPSGGHHNTHSGVMSPPPTGGPRPSPHSRPPPVSRPPPSPAPNDGGADPTLLPLFRAVDKDGTYHARHGLRRAAGRTRRMRREARHERDMRKLRQRTKQAPASSRSASSPPPWSTATGRPLTRTRCA